MVGCRTGGLPAVISAAENGAKVLGIEQMSAIATPREDLGAMIDWIADIVERNGEFRMWFEGSIGTENAGARDKAWATGHSPEKLTDDEAVTFGTCLRDYAIELGAEFRYDTMLVKCE